MSNEVFLISDLTLIIQETKRRHSDVKEAAEKALGLLKDQARPKDFSPESTNAADLIAPISLGMKTKNPKVVALCIGSIQRLVSLGAVSESRLPSVIQSLASVVNQGVDIQLKVLQTILVILTTAKIHGSLLGEAFRICFELRGSRMPVVSSTAAASLRQGVMVIFDKISLEDTSSAADETTSSIELSDGSTVHLRPAALDGYRLFEDLCILTDSAGAVVGLDKAESRAQNLLNLDSLPEPFGLELIESILSNHATVFKKHPELLVLLHHDLCPLLLSNLSLPTSSAPSSFPLTLRLIRVIYLLLRSFPDKLVRETEILLSFLLKILSGESASLGHMPGSAPIRDMPEDSIPSGSYATQKGEQSPGWLRVLAMECIRGLCSDGVLLRKIWMRYSNGKSTEDADSDRDPSPLLQPSDPSTMNTSDVTSSPSLPASVPSPPQSNLFPALLSILHRIASEKPGLLGTSTQLNGIGVYAYESVGGDGNSPGGSQGGVGGSLGAGGLGQNPYGSLEMISGIVASGVSSVVASLTTDAQAGLGEGSTVKVQCIDQLDKIEPPVLPDTYLYLLALQCVNIVIEGFSSVITPVYATVLPLRSSLAIAKGTLGLYEESEEVQVTRKMMEAGWPALLAALSFFLGRNLSDELFSDTLASLHEATVLCGLLGLTTERDAFIGTLSRLAVPPAVVSALTSYENATTPKSQGGVLAGGAEALGLISLTGPSVQEPPSLSSRNLICLKVLIGVAEMIGGGLGKSWFDVLEVLQSASFVLAPTKRQANASNKKRSTIIPISIAHQSSNSNLRVTSAGPSSYRDSTRPSVNPRSSSSMDRQSDLPSRQGSDLESIQSSISHIFDATTFELDPEALTEFVSALCRLSEEMLGLVQPQTQKGGASKKTHSEEGPASSLPDVKALRDAIMPKRRRSSGLHLLKDNRHRGDRSFAIDKIAKISSLNLHRLVVIDPSQGWSLIVDHLLATLCEATASSTIRLQAAEVLDEFLVNSIRVSNESVDSGIHPLVVSSLAAQVERTSSGQFIPVEIDIRRLGLEALHQILQSAGHALVDGWEMVFVCLRSVCRRVGEQYSQLETLAEDGKGVREVSTSSPILSHRKNMSGVSIRGNASLIRAAFQSVILVTTDFLSSFSVDHLRQCVLTLADFSRQVDDVNISLSSIGSLWNVSDFIQSKRPEQTDRTFDDLWFFSVRELLTCCIDSRAEVRSSATQTLFRSMELYGSTLDAKLWESCIWEIIFPLLDSLSAFAESEVDDNTDASRWSDSRVLTLSSVGSLFSKFFLSDLSAVKDSIKVWRRLLDVIVASFKSPESHVSTAAVQALKEVLSTWVSHLEEDNTSNHYEPYMTDTWAAWETMGTQIVLISLDDTPVIKFTQASLLAFIGALLPLLVLSPSLWSIDRLSNLSTTLRSVMTYPCYDDTRSDLDNPTPLQALIFEALKQLNIEIPGSSALLLQESSSLITLAFASSQTDRQGQSPRRITYVAVSKEAMTMALQMFESHQTDPELYSSGAVSQLIKAYGLPAKLKYDCPPSYKFEEQPPLWKTATTLALQVIRITTSVLTDSNLIVAKQAREDLWNEIIDYFVGVLLVDPRATEDIPMDAQTADETHDLKYLAALEKDIVPVLGWADIPDLLIVRLANALSTASQFYYFDSDSSETSLCRPRPTSFDPRIYQSHDGDGDGEVHGITAEIIGHPKERFSRWCFDVMFMLVDKVDQNTDLRQRVAKLVFPLLMYRCQTVLSTYLADQPLRGGMPFPRLREEELVYVLKKLLELSMYEGSVITSDDITSMYQHSPRAHLFILYPLLLDIALLPRRTQAGLDEGYLPIGYGSGVEDEIIGGKLDARALAGECLQLVGAEWKKGGARA
ncbi:Uncharacterized conserved protein [Phaffia rhodozyma]|uniref:Uncharacterized conserved protein n=1 Tax=Phaffia rhodozyma TaxID=264483 RepID=A0A0F7SKS3_PHARH|nr:Uncharacterized conserved protein [Phaffia rhodozyma]